MLLGLSERNYGRGRGCAPVGDCPRSARTAVKHRAPGPPGRPRTEESAGGPRPLLASSRRRGPGETASGRGRRARCAWPSGHVLRGMSLAHGDRGRPEPAPTDVMRRRAAMIGFGSVARPRVESARQLCPRAARPAAWSTESPSVALPTPAVSPMPAGSGCVLRRDTEQPNTVDETRRADLLADRRRERDRGSPALTRGRRAPWARAGGRPRRRSAPSTIIIVSHGTCHRSAAAGGAGGPTAAAPASAALRGGAAASAPTRASGGVWDDRTYVYSMPTRRIADESSVRGTLREGRRGRAASSMFVGICGGKRAGVAIAAGIRRTVHIAGRGGRRRLFPSTTNNPRSSPAPP